MPDYAETTGGMRIDTVLPGRLAEKAGLLKDDVIVEISGKPVTNASTYTTVMAGFKYGDTIDVVVKRGAEKKTFKIKLEQPQQP
jgi:S1-C subfamily serine protease